jgi:ABC-type bacteriocin/lantibiotic exporter with double-glycine peptidase domain
LFQVSNSSSYMAPPESPSLSPLKRVLRLLRHYRAEIRYILLYALVAGLINLSLPLGVQAIIGLLAGGSISASWGVLVFFVTLGAVFTGILRLMQLSIMEHLQRRIFADAALDFAIRIPRLNLERLRKEYLPELINRFFDTMTLQKGLPKMLIDGSTALITILLSLTVLSFYHPVFVTFSLLLLGILAGMFYLTGPSGLATSLTESKYKYNLVHWLEEVGRVASTFKLAGDSRFAATQADYITVNYLKARAKHWRILVIHFIGGLVFKVFVLGGFLILGSLLVMGNELNLGQFVASEILILFIIDAVDKLILLHETGYDILTATEKIGQFTDLPIEKDSGLLTAEFCRAQSLKVELKNLSYQYDDGHTPVLKNLHLIIQPGEKVAITGYSGAGVSTLMQIFSALKTDFSGSLLINDLPIQNLNMRNLRGHIGDLSSQEDIFKGTIFENITLGRPNLQLQAVLEAANETGLIDYIQKQPLGLDTPLLPGGKNIPGSVVTKLLVTRAIVGYPYLLALEKPLRGLTLQDRLRIGSVISNRKKNWTMIVSTEDPVMASLCDRIIVLRDGATIFDDNYQQLIQTPHCDHIFKFNLQQNSQP